MSDFLEQVLLHALEEKWLDLEALPGSADRQRRLADCQEHIHARLGPDFLDRLNDLEGEERYCQRLACFRYGFHLAGRLLWELFRQAGG